MSEELLERYQIDERFILSARVLVVFDAEPWGSENYNRDIVAINDEAYTDVRGLAEAVVGFLNERVLHWWCPACTRFGTCGTGDDEPVSSLNDEQIRGDLLSYGLALQLGDLTSTQRTMDDSGREVRVFEAYCGCQEED